MEKRFFLAAVLSLGVLFGFQSFFGPANKKAQPSAPTPPSLTSFEKSIVPDPLNVTTSLAEIAKDTASFNEKNITLENKHYQVELTNRGANVSRLILKEYAYSLPVRNLATLDAFDNLPFAFDLIDKNKLKSTHQGDGWLVEKDITLNDNFTISTTIVVKNTATVPQNFISKSTNILVDMNRLDKSNVQSDMTLFEYVFKSDKKFIRKNNVSNFNEKWNKQETLNINWVAFRDKYFVVLVQPKQEEMNYATNFISPKELVLGTQNEIKTVAPGQTIIYEYKIFAGPQKLDVLKNANNGFEKVLVFSDWGWLDAVSKAIYWMLGAMHKIVPNWGICIIFISLFVYGIMYPLTLKSLLSMKKLQALQPKMKELQEKYKNNQERLSKEIMELYKVNQVNPLGGCLPMILQMPIFVGLYQVLWRSVYFRGESFLWIKDLSMPDHTIKLPFTIPFLGEYVNILPILMIIIMGIQQKLNLQSNSTGTEEQVSQQKMMAVMLPILIGFIFYNMASGLNLYFVVFYILSTLSQWHISKDVKAIV